MRTVLYGIRLFNDVRHKHGCYVYMRQKEGGKRARQRRDREGECARKGGWQQEEVALVVKMTVEENRPFGIRIGLRR